MLFRLLIVLLQLYYSFQWCRFNTISDSSISGINEVDFSPDGQYVAVASGSAKKVVVYNFFTFNPVWSQTYAGNMNTAKFSRLGGYMAVGTTGSDTVTVYSVPGFAVYATFSAFNVSA
jgi:WD40 repeat protein